MDYFTVFFILLGILFFYSLSDRRFALHSP